MKFQASNRHFSALGRLMHWLLTFLFQSKLDRWTAYPKFRPTLIQTHCPGLDYEQNITWPQTLVLTTEHPETFFVTPLTQMFFLYDFTAHGPA